MIKSLNLEIINICNLKCSMCDIWKNKHWDILDEKNLDNILNSDLINNKTDISITWWEPLLHHNINWIFKYINNKWLKINTISTNWILTDKIIWLSNYCLDNNFSIPNIHISIDWMELNHDKQRWIVWSFKKSIDTIIKIKNIFKDVNIKIKYTITKNNISDIIQVYQLSKKIWVEISFKIVENDENYTNIIQKPILLNKNEKLNISKILKKMYNNTYIKNLIYYIENEKLNFECTTPIDNLFIMANWKVYCCTKYNSIWNIKENSLKEIIFNDIHKDIIKKVSENKCSKCFSLHWSYKTII